jgi:hypothetical protein
LERKAS